MAIYFVLVLFLAIDSFGSSNTDNESRMQTICNIYFQGRCYKHKGKLEDQNDEFLSANWKVLNSDQFKVIENLLERATIDRASEKNSCLALYRKSKNLNDHMHVQSDNCIARLAASMANEALWYCRINFCGKISNCKDRCANQCSIDSMNKSTINSADKSDCQSHFKVLNAVNELEWSTDELSKDPLYRFAHLYQVEQKRSTMDGLKDIATNLIDYFQSAPTPVKTTDEQLADCLSNPQCADNLNKYNFVCANHWKSEESGDYKRCRMHLYNVENAPIAKMKDSLVGQKIDPTKIRVDQATGENSEKDGNQ